ncbi:MULTISPECIES: helix-turn-helix transcriptional regulator [Aminobacterium]|uniref:helix-turn-helix transcriptional regulator n=1 Tax=Aminobacterium TaxID=81466 RepID=UPI00257D6E1D|nr:helix-turn-helix transcriptional regulator [Aminobacterium sp. UBA4987]
MKGISVQRKRKKMTQIQLAAAMGVTENTIYRWESDNPAHEVDPGIKNLKKLADLFSCTIDELINPTPLRRKESSAASI